MPKLFCLPEFLFKPSEGLLIRLKRPGLALSVLYCSTLSASPGLLSLINKPSLGLNKARSRFGIMLNFC